MGSYAYDGSQVRQKFPSKVSILEIGWRFSLNADPVLLLTAGDTIEAFSTELAIAVIHKSGAGKPAQTLLQPAAPG